MESPVRVATLRVKELGREAGFDLVRIAPAAPLEAERDRYVEWIESGRQGEMRWITPERAEASADPKSLLRRARSVISLGMAYWSGHRPDSTGRGTIARYAWGRDYHLVMGDRLRSLTEALFEEFGAEYRWSVDTGPLMDKGLAARAGLGWYGKNTNILTEKFGSFVLLGEIVTELALAPDRPLNRDCGSCSLCAVACPTGAIGPDYTIDARKCISYLTIEHRGPIERALRPLMGGWVFGCDICQDVCPPTMDCYLETKQERRAWAETTKRYVESARGEASQSGFQDREHQAPGARQQQVLANLNNPLFSGGIRPDVDLVWLLRLSHGEYVDAFRGTAVKRAKVWMLRRNAAIALGNIGDKGCVPALEEAMRRDDEPIVRGHAAWALGRLGERTRQPSIRETLAGQLDLETDREVREEIRLALRELHRLSK